VVSVVAASAALAGFAVPTQRAVVMISIALGAVVSRRAIHPASGLAAALLAVLAWDPFAVLAASFWLSFAAVALLLLLALGRIPRAEVLPRGRRLRRSASAIGPRSRFVTEVRRTKKRARSG